MDKMAELEKLVLQLKRNREKVPLNELKTKYRKAYDELREKISDLATEILRDQLRGIKIKADDASLIKEIEGLVAGIPDEAGEAIKRYDMEEFKSIATRLRTTVLQHIENKGGGTSD